jgi:hypothetical protein
MISIAAVEEVSYRQSRLCRLLGNPVAFTVVSLLADSKEMSTGEIARAIGRSIPRHQQHSWRIEARRGGAI